MRRGFAKITYRPTRRERMVCWLKGKTAPPAQMTITYFDRAGGVTTFTGRQR